MSIVKSFLTCENEITKPKIKNQKSTRTQRRYHSSNVYIRALMLNLCYHVAFKECELSKRKKNLKNYYVKAYRFYYQHGLTTYLQIFVSLFCACCAHSQDQLCPFSGNNGKPVFLLWILEDFQY